MPLDAERAWDILHDMEWADLQHWGFVVYRTDYQSENESRWADLLETIQYRIFEEIFCKPFGTPPPAKPSRAAQICQELWEAFQTDVRSDATRYDGVDLDKLRKMHRGEVEDEGVMVSVDEVDNDYKPRRCFFFLVADTEVLTTGLDEGWLKVVDAKYVAEDYQVRPNHPRGWTQQYWGWWKVALGVSHNLWFRLGEDREIACIAPRTTSGAHDVIWGGRE